MADAAVRQKNGRVRELRQAGPRVVCRACGRTKDTGCPEGERPCLDVAEQHGFAVDEAKVVFWGRCPACMAAAGFAAPERG